MKGDDSVITIDEWNLGVFDYSSVFRKEEKDWDTVYLARSGKIFYFVLWLSGLVCEYS